MGGISGGMNVLGPLKSNELNPEFFYLSYRGQVVPNRILLA